MYFHVTTCPIIFSYLSRGDPLSLVSYEIIDEVVKEFAGQVLRHAVDEIVHNHMTLIKADDWLNEFILEGVAPMIQTVVRTCFHIFVP